MVLVLRERSEGRSTGLVRRVLLYSMNTQGLGNGRGHTDLCGFGNDKEKKNGKAVFVYY